VQGEADEVLNDETGDAENGKLSHKKMF